MSYPVISSNVPEPLKREIEKTLLPIEQKQKDGHTKTVYDTMRPLSVADQKSKYVGKSDGIGSGMIVL